MYIHLFWLMTSSLPELACLCANLRRAARTLTQAYEGSLSSFGFTSTQFTILQVLWRTGELSQKSLGHALAMDSTTLTRTLRTMARSGWIQEHRGNDRREKRLRLSSAGHRALHRALPTWEAVQRRLNRKLGNQRWSQLQILLHQLTAITAA